MEDEELKRNYEQLHEQTGESYESIAARVEEHNSPDLAAWLRSKSAGDDSTREEAPKQRRAGKGSVAAAEAEGE